MWGGYNKLWTEYRSGILSVDADTADFLSDHMRLLTISRAYLKSLEVIDLQKYRVVKSPQKVNSAIRERLSIPFVFLSCNN